MRSPRLAALAACLIVLLGSGCAAQTTPSPTPSVTGELTGVCPNPVVVQTDWFAEAEYGAYFQLLGEPPTFDTAAKRVRAPLVAGGRPAGVDLEIRYGGPAIGFQQVSAQLYADPGITLGLVSTDEAIQNSARLATLAVLAPLELSPNMIMWDRSPASRRALDRRPGPGRRAGAVLRNRHLHAVPGGFRPAQTRAGGRQLRRQPVPLGGRRRNAGPGRLRHLGALHLPGRAGRRPQLRRRPAAGQRHRLPDLRPDPGHPGSRPGPAGAVSGQAGADGAAGPGRLPRRPGPDQQPDRAGRAGRQRLGVELLPRAGRLRGAHHAGAGHRRQRPHPHARATWTRSGWPG